MPLLHEDQVIRETYLVERFLGEGAFGEVYRVRHNFLGRQAMKVFKAVGMTPDDTLQVLEEAVILSRIGHPNIIRVFEANIAETTRGNCGYFTMEYVAGGSLEQFWRSYDTQFVPIEISVDIIRQVCRGLAVAHNENPPIIHRDIKPQNILVGYDPSGLRVRVSDFGLARRVNPLTMMATAKGTRSFKAPEVFRDGKSDSRAGDVWAIGTTLYLLLTDRLPYPEVANPELLDKDTFKRAIIPPGRLNLTADPFLDQITLRALALKPEDRYASAGEMLTDLEKWKPRAAEEIGVTKSAGQATKDTLGLYSSADEEKARQMISEANVLARSYRLPEAADLLEEALNKFPGLRDEYEYRLKLWRRGKVQ